MRVEPTRRHRTAIWNHEGDAVSAIGVWTQGGDRPGEDAEPLFVHHLCSGEGVTGVFDGAGGSGAGVAFELDADRARSGAWVASRVARAAVESWFCDRVRSGSLQDVHSLRGLLADLLGRMRPNGRSKLVGTMRRELPTTMAVAHYRLSGESMECHAMWAGDSRVYVLTPRGGLQALTRDHTVETDALEQLLRDPPMTNLLSADGRFSLGSHQQVVGLPCVLLCATDGFFGYVPTPAHFECHLLRTLSVAYDAADWSDRLAEAVTRYTGDDASLSLVAVGFGGFADLRSSFDTRAHAVMAHWRAQVDTDDRTDEVHRRRNWRKESWERYRPGYERLMPPLPEGHL